jgi:hypothetical protein
MVPPKLYDFRPFGVKEAFLSEIYEPQPYIAVESVDALVSLA